MNDLEKLFIGQLKDLYDGEHRLLEALPEMEQEAKLNAVRSAFGEQMRETKSQISRLERVFEETGQAPGRRTCYGMDGIVEEGREMLKSLVGNSAADVVLIASAQKANHYAIAGYGSLATWADQLDYDKALPVLEENLWAAKESEEKLARLAEACRENQVQRQHGLTSEIRQIFLTHLQEIYDAEHMLAGALDELEVFADSRLLKLSCRHHLNQTEKHWKRLEEVFAEFGAHAMRRSCKGIEGIIDEAQILVEEFLGNPALDAAVIAAAQKAEHYEIATYNALSSWARDLGEKKALSLLQENLSDEKETDKALTLLAKASRNRAAAKTDSPKKSEEEAELLKVITHGP